MYNLVPGEREHGKVFRTVLSPPETFVFKNGADTHIHVKNPSSEKVITKLGMYKSIVIQI